MNALEMNPRQKKMLQRIVVSAGMLLMVILLEHFSNLSFWLIRLLALIPYWWIGHDVLKKAFKGIQNKQVFDESFLMSVATIGAMILGEIIEGVAVMLFYQIGEFFQQIAVGQSRKSIQSLMDIRPDYANIEKEDGTLEKVDPDDLPIGTIIVVSPGEKVPIDGIVVEGMSSLNTAALTGESLPKEVQVGDEVISGCINQTGILRIQTTKLFEESTVAKILDLVEHSSMKKAKAENFIAKFARIYTPAVCYSALALALIPPLVLGLTGSGWDFSPWVFRALTFLVISCPCALVVSIPLSFFGGIGGASRNGILVKGSNYLEALADAKIIVFDKTGTLTKGSFAVSGVYPSSGISKETLLEYAALAEGYSSHPVAKSLKDAVNESLDLTRMKDEKEIAGFGVEAIVDGEKVLVGNEKLMKQEGISYQPCEETGTIVYVSKGDTYLGAIVINDVIKDSSKHAIQRLKEMGIQKTVMLTGDNEKVAQHVSNELQLDAYHAQLLPIDKVNQMEELLAHKQDKEILCFVGDGMNDAPVLSRADVGIAMGALGSDAAIEAADIVLMDDDIDKIPMAIQIAKKCLKIVKENVVFSIAIKIGCLILSAFGIADMWWAVFADVGVMVLAVLNATRTLRILPGKVS